MLDEKLLIHLDFCSERYSTLKPDYRLGLGPSKMDSLSLLMHTKKTLRNI